jgi:hypothetical protein
MVINFISEEKKSQRKGALSRPPVIICQELLRKTAGQQAANFVTTQ